MQSQSDSFDTVFKQSLRLESYGCVCFSLITHPSKVLLRVLWITVRQKSHTSEEHTVVVQKESFENTLNIGV